MNSPIAPAGRNPDAAVVALRRGGAALGGSLGLGVASIARFGRRALRRRILRILFGVEAVWFRVRPPKSLNAKIRAKMAFDRRPILRVIANKWTAREFVRERIGERVLTRVFLVADDPQVLRHAEMPNRCVIKPAHASGAVVILDDRVPRGREVPRRRRGQPWGGVVRIHPGDVRPEQLEALAGSWLGADYSRHVGPLEWAYQDAPRRIIVEELLEQEDGAPPSDFKFWCMGGMVRFLQVNIDRFGHHRRLLVHPDWSRVEGRINQRQPEVLPDPPEHLMDMLSIARRLSEDLDFVRVDLYEARGRVLFGELTNYPEIGWSRMRPRRVFDELASDWNPTIPRLTRNRDRRSPG